MHRSLLLCLIILALVTEMLLLTTLLMVSYAFFVSCKVFMLSSGPLHGGRERCAGQGMMESKLQNGRQTRLHMRWCVFYNSMDGHLHRHSCMYV